MPKLIAYKVTDSNLDLVTAPHKREWMEANGRWAYKCLPMVIASQSGWLVLTKAGFSVIWDGTGLQDGVRVIPDDPQGPPCMAKTWFGYGTFTIDMPWLFRTDPEYNLLARGPANLHKDGVAPLEGVVETDWVSNPFTMNWKLTRPDHLVHFAPGEPVCMLVPQRKEELEDFEPSIEEPEGQEKEDYQAWLVPRTLNRTYVQGKTLDGRPAPEGAHRRKRDLRPFS